MSKFKKKVKKLMENHNYELVRERNHQIWRNEELGQQIVLPSTPRSEETTILNIKREIRRVYRLNDNFPQPVNDNNPPCPNVKKKRRKMKC